MRQLDSLSALGRALVILALAVLGALGVVAGAAGCTLALETDLQPHKCRFDSECAHLRNAACDNAHARCVPRLPRAGESDGGAPPSDANSGGDGREGGDGGGARDGGVAVGGGDARGLTCQLAFDNRRVQFGPDGGLRPLPETP